MKIHSRLGGNLRLRSYVHLRGVGLKEAKGKNPNEYYMQEIEGLHAANAEELEALRIKYLSKKGAINDRKVSELNRIFC